MRGSSHKDTRASLCRYRRSKVWKEVGRKVLRDVLSLGEVCLFDSQFCSSLAACLTTVQYYFLFVKNCNDTRVQQSVMEFKRLMMSYVLLAMQRRNTCAFGSGLRE